MDFTDRVRGWFKGVKAAPTERKIANILAGGEISNDPFPKRVGGNTFESGTSYFGLRLSGLYIVDARSFATSRLPLCVCLAEFATAGERRSIPFSIGPDVIRRKLKDAGITENTGKPAWIELRDLTVVRPTPVSDSNLSLYAGLFSVPGDDLVKSLLNVVGTVGTALANPAIGAAIKVADSIYDSFGTLLGYDQVQPLVAALIGNALTDKGSGYLLVANVSPKNFDVRRARVDGGRLHWPAEQNGGNEVTEFDHALLALEYFNTVTEPSTGLSESLFGQPWAVVRVATNRESAEEALQKLLDAISASPDLTEEDRLKLLAAYAAAAKKLFDARWPPKARAATGGDLSSIQTRLTNAAAALGTSSLNVDKHASETLFALSKIDQAIAVPAPLSRDAKKHQLADANAIFGFAHQVKITHPAIGQAAVSRRAATAFTHAMLPAHWSEGLSLGRSRLSRELG